MSYAKNGNAKIYYESYGVGPALIFAHGAGGNASSWWQQVPYFADRYRVITFDHRGFGRSICPDEELDIKRFVDDLVRIMDTEEIDKAILVCQSMGGWTGMGMAVNHPERVNALIMSHTGGGISSDEIVKERERSEGSRAPITNPFGSWAVAPDFPDKNIKGSHLYNQIGSFNTNKERLKMLGGTRDPVDHEKLKGYSIPTLFITAAQDQIFSPRLIDLVSELVPGSRVEHLGDAGHSSYFEVPELFNKTVDDFLSSLEL
jgi:3-oxoadipate enol-lactonase